MNKKHGCNTGKIRYNKDKVKQQKTLNKLNEAKGGRQNEMEKGFGK